MSFKRVRDRSLLGDIVASRDGVGGVRADDSDAIEHSEPPDGDVEGIPVGVLGDTIAPGS